MIYLHKLLEMQPSATVIHRHHSSLLRLLFVKQLQRVTPPLVRSIQGGGVDGRQYANDRYAVRKNPLIRYADIHFYF